MLLVIATAYVNSPRPTVAIQLTSESSLVADNRRLHASY